MEGKKCDWCLGNSLYEDYHDNEWGKPLHDDQKLFEFLVLESFQAGLSWLTILKKRENFRVAFDDFEIDKVSEYSAEKINHLCQDAGIVRNQKKIDAAIQNAKSVQALQKEYGSFDMFIWKYVDFKPIQSEFLTLDEVPSQTELSQKISRDLKQKGFLFLGPTTVYAFMQAIGMTNDHLIHCPVRSLTK
ncbi:MAG: DNA-3-methyladenine glycosylase I [Psychroflexus sp.]|nr:DNA-3-methyladenine glycosylase I [Psychroflexus sp.]MDN6310348.1 DNA-3-methyladenine glycosylase I [Psychroflexus sp.]